MDNLVVRDNVIQENGTDPDPVSFVPGADIAFAADVVDPNTGTLLLPDPDPTDNCFANNIFDTEFVLATALGAPTLADFPCP